MKVHETFGLYMSMLNTCSTLTTLKTPTYPLKKIAYALFENLSHIDVYSPQSHSCGIGFVQDLLID